MKHPFRFLSGLLVAGAAFAVVVGCSKSTNPIAIMNQPPTVRMTQAPVSSLKSDSVFYAYRINWVGFDPDGRVDYFMYAIDPHSVDVVDSTWVRTTSNEQFLLFKARNPDLINHDGGSSTADESHVFALVAVDNLGKMSTPIARAFFSYTIAPVVEMVDPLAGHLNIVSPSVHLVWSGRDPDGVFTQKPIKYKFRLFKSGATPSDFPFPVQENDFLTFALGNPDSVRKGYAPTFPGWDSTSAETLETQYANLVPNSNYLFIVTGFDEAGAYDPVFSLNSNMLQLYVTFAGNAAPKMTVFSDFFFYSWVIGGNLTDPAFWFRIEVPGQQPNLPPGSPPQTVTFNWFATPQGGASIRRYRWVMDLVDLDDESPRSDEQQDWFHWSQWGLSNLSGTIGPFTVNGETHNFIVQAEDNNNLRTTVVVSFVVVLPTFDIDLLVVNDTRFRVDDAAPGGGVRPPALRWPTAAELDTFLSAKGGVPWKSYPAGTLTQPGIFAGYRRDTLGTRGMRDPIVPLSTLARYKHVVWLTDQEGAGYSGNSFERIRPTTSLRAMNNLNQANTLSTYIRQGGFAWMLGGGIARASLEPRESDQNRGRWNFRDGDLVPGRMLYDFAHIRNELSVGGTGAEVRRGALVAVLGSDGRPIPGQFRVDPPGGLNPEPEQPAYATLPRVLELRKKVSDTPADPVPPLRENQPSTFYVNTFAIEAMTNFGQVGGNFIREDLNGSAPGGLASTLDTLYHYVTQTQGGFDPIGFYYHGHDNQSVVFMGFPLWEPKRAQATALVDFVLGELWGLRRTSVPQQSAIRATAAATTVRRSPASPGASPGLLRNLGFGRSAPASPVLAPVRPRN